jgi:septum formation protein
MLWAGDTSLILASQSQSRQALLKAAGLDVEAMPADLDERGIQDESGLTDPSAVAALLARAKAKTVAARNDRRIVIGADQTLSLHAHIFGKPVDRADAINHLRQFSGQMHELHSAVAVVRDGETLFEHVSIARMTMRKLSDEAIATYLDAAGDRVMTSVGAYQLEGLGVHLFDRIDGDHFTILGLPLLPLLRFLRSQKLLAF